jgi:hypothetical protein
MGFGRPDASALTSFVGDDLGWLEVPACCHHLLSGHAQGAYVRSTLDDDSERTAEDLYVHQPNYARASFGILTRVISHHQSARVKTWLQTIHDRRWQRTVTALAGTRIDRTLARPIISDRLALNRRLRGSGSPTPPPQASEWISYQSALKVRYSDIRKAKIKVAIASDDGELVR